MLALQNSGIDLISFASRTSVHVCTRTSKTQNTSVHTKNLWPSIPLSALLTLLLHDLSCGANPTACDDFFSAGSSAVSTLAAADDAAAER